MSKKSQRLGKGLSTLMAPREQRTGKTTSMQPVEADEVRQIPLPQIRRNPRQPRTTFSDESIAGLAASIRASGVLQPVLVRALPSGEYELVAGERRWRAAKLAGLDTVAAIVRSVSDADAVKMALTENLQREDLNVLERAAAYQDYIDTFHVSADELGQRLGESRANIANYLRLLSLPDEIKNLISGGQLGMGHARAIAGIVDPQRQLAIARLAVRRNLAVRQVEELARNEVAGRAQMSRETGGEAEAGHVSEVEQALSRALGLKVKLQPGRKRNAGRIVITYRNLEEFDRIAEKIGGGSVVECS